MGHTTTAALAALSATALTATLAATPSQAAGSTYVALGDSFSSGTGTRAKVDSCYRSPYGYPSLLADQLKLRLDYQACQGADTADVRTRQLGALDRRTSYVTMTVGGNDIGFADVLTECALPGWMSDCDGHIAAALTTLRTQLPGRLDTLYAEIDSRAPKATVAVASYPYLFMGEDCDLATFFSPGEQADINAGTAELDELIKARAGTAGFTYVEVRDDFLGHAVCDSPEWINGFSSPIEESYHPNRLGNAAYAAAIAPALGTTSAGAKGRATSTEPTVREQADAVLAMEIDSPANLRAAREHGVDTGRVTRATAKLRSASAAVVEAGLVELDRLDADFEARG